ncbi:MAG: beta-lactamase family protein, partial [Gemmatimonadetes bacterium]|nr:beta-lactamase family protein [Gemmatimonadota bacterium]
MNMRHLFLLLVVAGFSSSCSDADPSAEFEELGLFVDSLSVEHGVPGVGFALFDASGLLYEHVSGVKSQATLEPIDANTAFEAASISKPVFAYVVFSLVRDGLLDLDAPLETLVPEVPEVAYDPRSAALTPRILL